MLSRAVSLSWPKLFRKEFETVEIGSRAYLVKRPISNSRTDAGGSYHGSIFNTVFSILFLSAASVALFSFLAVAFWSGARRKERESYYKNEMLKKISEAQGAGAGAALALLREESRLAATRRQASLRIGGLSQYSLDWL